MIQALLQFEGETGTLLRYVIAHERGEWEQIDWQDLAARQIDESLFEQTYRESLIWATGIMQSLLD